MFNIVRWMEKLRWKGVKSFDERFRNRIKCIARVRKMYVLRFHKIQDGEGVLWAFSFIIYDGTLDGDRERLCNTTSTFNFYKISCRLSSCSR